MLIIREMAVVLTALTVSMFAFVGSSAADTEASVPAPAEVTPTVTEQKPKVKLPKRKVSLRTYVTSRSRAEGWGAKQFSCLNEILWRESSWTLTSDNPNSSAYGLFQLLKLKPGTSREKQVTLGFKYIKHRYGTPCKALAFHNKHGWY